jgi:epoxide hydrolase-like predicted phosphatase
MSIEALIFDIGNVLVPFDWQIFRNRLREERVDLTAAAEEKFKELMLRIDVGEMTGEAFIQQAIRAIAFQRDEQTFLSIWNGIFSSNLPMEQTILTLKAQFPLFLLSNTSELHLAYLMANRGVLQHFADGVYSFRAKCAKPDREIFEKAIEQFGVEPENTVYVDDLPANINSASKLGFRAIRYDLKRHDEFERRLVELGIAI